MLLLAVVLLAAGMLVVTPLLSQVATMLQKEWGEREQRMKVYAAEGAIYRLMADLVRGADGTATIYTTTSPHAGNQSYQTFTITSSYALATTTVNSYTPAVTVMAPSDTQAKPVGQQSYVDPGADHPALATVPSGYSYLMRLYNVKSGTLRVNWAYSPAGISRVGVWAGMPVDNQTNQPFPPGQLDGWPREHPILDTGFSNANATYNQTAAIAVDPATDGSGGVYTIVFDNSRGNQSKTTAAFAASGATTDTWIYVKAYKDYVVTASVGPIAVTAYIRQVPGFSEPPGVVPLGGGQYSHTWATDNISFITNEVYAYSWLSP